MENPWRFVERVTVRNLHTGFIGEARHHAQFEVGEIKDSPAEALESAVKKLTEARIAQHAAYAAKHKPKPSADDWEDLL